MKKFFAFLICSLTSIAVHAQQTTIKNVNVIDVKAGKVRPEFAVIVSGEKVSWVGPVNKLPKNIPQGEVIDGTGKYLMPGLIDSHIHFFQSGSLYTRPDGVDLNHIKPYHIERAEGWKNTTDYLNRYLRLGITTVVDVGGPLSNFAIRDSIGKAGVYPDILVTGPLFSMVARQKLALNDPPIVRVATAAQADSLFNKMLPHKPDFIKIWYIATRDIPAEKSFPLVRHIGELCAARNLKLAVHATQLKTAQLAVDAGATILVHSVDDEIIPDAFVKTLLANKVTYIPTLIVSNNYPETFAGKLEHHPQDLRWANAFAYGTLMDLEQSDSSAWPPVIKRLRKNGIPAGSQREDSIMWINLKKLVKAGVNVATGTDAGNIGTFHASSYLQELESMQKAGLSNAEIIKASTINAAIGFGLGGTVGAVEKDRKANLLLLSKNPLESLANLDQIEIVFKDGKALKPGTILSESPEAVVQRQLIAYNARNIDQFLATYADDIEIYRDGKVIMKGHDQMRERYAGFFKDVTNLHCKIENRIVIRNKVIDKEKVRAGTRIIHAVAVYEVEHGKIKKVTFFD